MKFLAVVFFFDLFRQQKNKQQDDGTKANQNTNQCCETLFISDEIIKIQKCSAKNHQSDGRYDEEINKILHDFS